MLEGFRVMALLLRNSSILDSTCGIERIVPAAELLDRAAELAIAFPQMELSQAYWDVSFEFLYTEGAKPALNLLLVLTSRQRRSAFQMPSAIGADYFVVDNTVMPIRASDVEALRTLAPLVHRDDDLELSISELLSFDYYAAKNGLSISNPDIRDQFLANPEYDTTGIKHGLALAPYPYQAVGIEWLCTQQSLGHKGVILADVMGLGKTLQIIGLITRNVMNDKINNLVICPATLLENWRRELGKFSPSMKALIHFGPMRSGIARKLTGFDVVFTTYDVLISDHSMLSSINWNIVVLDEAQNIKNPSARRSLRSKELMRHFSVAVTGTPLENRLRDIWSLVGFADDSIFGTEWEFESLYESSTTGAYEVNQLIRPILLRRKLADIDHQLPEKVIIDHPLTWPPELNEVYEQVRMAALQEFGIAGGLVATGRLRKLTTHPRLMGFGPKDLSALSPKFSLTISILDELFADNEKALIFTSYLDMIDGLKDHVALAYPHAFIRNLDGRVPIDERTELVDAFNKFEGPGLLVCNTTVAGAGLNITGANHVIHYNLEWNPAREDQATFRVYRNGQVRESFIHRLFYVDTIDEVIDQRIKSKRELADMSIDAGVSSADYLAGLQATPMDHAND